MEMSISMDITQTSVVFQTRFSTRTCSKSSESKRIRIQRTSHNKFEFFCVMHANFHYSAQSSEATGTNNSSNMRADVNSFLPLPLFSHMGAFRERTRPDLKALR